jgi:heterodisulfide reductase subunit C
MMETQLETLLANCTRCGLCRDVCIVERLGGHSITSFLCGEKEYSSWLCSSCWRCQEACPEGVDIHSVMMAKRREEEVPGACQANFRRLLESGYALPMDETINEWRRFYGLDEVKPIPAEWVRVLLRSEERMDKEGER